MYVSLGRRSMKAIVFFLLLFYTSIIAADTIVWDEAVNGELGRFSDLQFNVGVNTVIADTRTGFGPSMQFNFSVPKGAALIGIDYIIHNITLFDTATGLFVETYITDPTAVVLNKPLYPVGAAFIGERPPGGVSVADNYTYSPGDEGALFNNIWLESGEYDFRTRVGYYGSYPGGGIMENTFEFKLTSVPIPSSILLFSSAIAFLSVSRKQSLFNKNK